MSTIKVEEPEHPQPEWTKPVKWDIERAVAFREKLLRSKKTAPYEELQRSQAIVNKIDPKPDEFSLEALCRLWKHPRKNRAVVDLLRTVIGDVPYNEINQAHIVQFRDHLDSMGKMGTLDKATQSHYLSRLKSVFSAVVSENKIQINPVAGIQVNGKKQRRQVDYDKPFTGAEIRIVLAKAEEIRFGSTLKFDRHEEMMWGLRMLAYTGARPGEIFQLRKCDVYIDDKVPIIYIRENHPQQSVKTGQSRKVPIHPHVAGFLDFAQSRDDFVFGSFTWSKDNNRVGWLGSRFHRFLVDECKITTPKKSAYSFRHRFIDSLRNAEVHPDIERVIVGHSGGIHGRYGKGHLLKRMAEEIAKARPLDD